jgi:hypothetical protein
MPPENQLLFVWFSPKIYSGKRGRKMISTQNVYLEVVGEANEAAFKNIFGNLEARVLPYARLGDFTLQVSICADAIKQMVFKDVKVQLEQLGFTVLGAH